MKEKTMLLLFTFGQVLAMAQSQPLEVFGKVINRTTGKGMVATIQYQSLPTGGMFGSFTDSLYRFEIFGDARYKITATAPGFTPVTVVVSPRQEGGTHFERNLVLTEANRTFRLHHLIFAQSEAVIEPSSFAELDEVVLLMQDHPTMRIQLEGHTDPAGDAKLNLKLSRERVEAVKKYLTSKGVAPQRIRTQAFGGSQPVTQETTPEARALNRRVEIRVLNQ